MTDVFKFISELVETEYDLPTLNETATFSKERWKSLVKTQQGSTGRRDNFKGKQGSLDMEDTHHYGIWSSLIDWM